MTLTAADLACTKSSDCAWMNTGPICSRACVVDLCRPLSPLNRSAAARVSAAIASLPDTPSGCTPWCTLGPPTSVGCFAGQCQWCPDPDCRDADAALPDAGAPGSATWVNDAGTTCVTVAASSYELACGVASDCVAVLAGAVCDGDCSCSNAAINRFSEATYQADVAGITLAACQCVAPPTVCTNGVCGLQGGPPP